MLKKLKLLKKMENKYLMFNRYSDKEVAIWHKEDNVQIARLEYMRVGAWMSWCLMDLHNDYYLSAGCLDEIRDIQKKLNVDKHYCIKN